VEEDVLPSDEPWRPWVELPEGGEVFEAMSCTLMHYFYEINEEWSVIKFVNAHPVVPGLSKSRAGPLVILISALLPR
jgi:hypothetical protein